MSIEFVDNQDHLHYWLETWDHYWLNKAFASFLQAEDAKTLEEYSYWNRTTWLRLLVWAGDSING